jgi:acetyl-CoA carboxylase carboxyl transferase subunit beta
MGSVLGKKITRLIEYATDKSLLIIIVCAFEGARMQEGTLSLMQMAEISAASPGRQAVLQIHQVQRRLFYISVPTYLTTSGATASFGMLGT